LKETLFIGVNVLVHEGDQSRLQGFDLVGVIEIHGLLQLV
jgi:hypothetical protein